MATWVVRFLIKAAATGGDAANAYRGAKSLFNMAAPGGASGQYGFPRTVGFNLGSPNPYGTGGKYSAVDYTGLINSFGGSILSHKTQGAAVAGYMNTANSHFAGGKSMGKQTMEGIAAFGNAMASIGNTLELVARTSPSQKANETRRQILERTKRYVPDYRMSNANNAALTVAIKPMSQYQYYLNQVEGHGPWGLIDQDVKAHTIRPKNGKALKVNGNYYSQVNHPGTKGKHIWKYVEERTMKSWPKDVYRSVAAVLSLKAASSNMVNLGVLSSTGSGFLGSGSLIPDPIANIGSATNIAGYLD